MTTVTGIDALPVQSGSALPLDGFLVGITADRRKDELAALLERRGARTTIGTAIKLVPLEDDTELLAASRALIASPPRFVVATTGIGFRGWMEAVDGWGMGDSLRAAMSGARILARGPKARGAIRAAGLTEEWSPASESSTEVLEYLLNEDLAGARVAVQLHGEPLPFLVEAVTEAGAEVVEVPVYRWTVPADTNPLDRLVRLAAAGGVDALTFTSAPAAVSTLQRAAELGVREDLLAGMRGERVLACCVGPVTAAPLRELGIPTYQPERARLGSMVRHVCDVLVAHAAPTLPVAGHRLAVRATGAVLDGAFVDVKPTQLALLRALTDRPGHVLTRAELAEAMPGTGDEHAVEMAMTRLRTSLGEPRLIQTVVKRGYRLAYEPEAGVEGVCDPA